MRLRSPLFILSVAAFLALFFLSTWQGYRYRELEQGIKALEASQEDWLEENKKIIAALAILSSPRRLDLLAREKLGLKPLAPEDLIKVRLKRGGR